MWEVYSFNSWQWCFNLFLFFPLIFVSWFLPGLYLLSFSKLKKELQFILSPILGITLFAITSYVFGWLNLRFLMYGFVLLFAFLFWKRKKQIFPLRLSFPFNKFVWGAILGGAILQLVSIFGSGWRTSKGIVYYFVNIFDGVFHLSLSRSIMEIFPPYQPGAVGIPVTNYHYLSNLVIGELSRLYHLPLNHIHFHYVPLFLSIWLGILVAALLWQWSKNNWTVWIGVILYYFVGEMTWLINWVLGSNSAAPFEAYIDHGMIQFMNPPQAFARAIFLGSLILWHKFWKKPSIYLATSISLMTATLVGFKVYFGLAVGVGLGTVLLFKFIWEIFKQLRAKKKVKLIEIVKEYIPHLIIIGLTSLIGAVIYFPTNASAGGMFYAFLFWPKEFLGFTKLNWNEWWLRLQVYQAAKNYKALFVWYSLAASIFYFAIFHIRLLGTLVFFKKFRQKVQIEELIFLVITSLVFIFVGTNFLQSSGGANSFNFFVVALAMLAPLTAVVLGSFKNRLIRVLVVVLLIVTSVQGIALQFFFWRNYYQGHNSYVYTAAHQETLSYLRDLDKPVRLQMHQGNHIGSNSPYLYFFTGQESYLNGIQILESHNQKIEDRLANVEEIFNLQLAATKSAELGNDLGISHVLLERNGYEGVFINRFESTATYSAFPHWEEVFANDEFVVFETVLPQTN